MPLSLKPLFRLTVPIILLAMSIASLTRINHIDSSYLQLLGLFPYLVFVITLGLAHYFNRSRYFATTLLLAFAFWIIQTDLQATLDEAYPFYLYSSLSIFIPITLLMLTTLPERGLWNKYGVLSLTLSLSILLASYLLYPYIDSATHQQLKQLLTIKPYPNYVMSMAASVCFILCFLVIAIQLTRKNTEAEASLCSCLIFVFVTLAFFYQPYISTVMFSAAGITLIIGLLRSSHEMAYRDDLTGLLSRRALNERLRSLGRHYSIAMLDIDHFKKFNDTHGHDVGDDVLKIVANHISTIGGGGTPYRYGGEEFCIIFSGKPLNACISHLETLRETIAGYKIILRDKKNRPKTSKEGENKRGATGRHKKVSVTISIGLAEKIEKTDSPEQILKSADRALYEAKKKGRNCLAY